MSDTVFYGFFCDDVRHEVSGKFTLVGCYGTEVVVPEFPFVLSKICFSFTFTCKKDCFPRSLSVYADHNGEVVYRMDLSSEIQIDNPDDEEVVLYGGFEIKNLRFTENGILKVKAECDEHVLFGPHLKISGRNDF